MANGKSECLRVRDKNSRGPLPRVGSLPHLFACNRKAFQELHHPFSLLRYHLSLTLKPCAISAQELQTPALRRSRSMEALGNAAASPLRLLHLSSPTQQHLRGRLCFCVGKDDNANDLFPGPQQIELEGHNMDILEESFPPSKRRLEMNNTDIWKLFNDAQQSVASVKLLLFFPKNHAFQFTLADKFM